MSVALPSDLEAIARDLDAVGREAERLVTGVGEDAFHWQPARGAWSLAQCLDHLAVANRVYLRAIDAGARAGSPVPREGPIAPGLIGRLFIRNMEPPVRKRMRLRAPRAIVPGPRRPSPEILSDLLGALANVKAFVHAHAAHDLNRLTFPNPFLPGVRMGIGTGLLVITSHNRRHLWQAKGVRERPDWPGPA